MKHLHKAISLSLALALALAVGFSVPALAAETLAIQIEGPGIYTIELSGVVKQEQRTLLVASGADVYEKDETVYTVDPELFSYSISWDYPDMPNMEYSDKKTAMISCYIEQNGVYDTWDFLDGSAEVILRPEYAEKYDMFYLQNDFAGIYIELDGKNDSGQPGQPAEPTGVFTDLPLGAYYSEPVKWAVREGIAGGTSATTFSPDATCNTAQILTFLWRANGSPEPAAASTFTDVPADAYYAKAVAWATEKGLVSGATLNGDAPCTRLTTVTYLWKLAGKPSDAGSSEMFTDLSAEGDAAKAVSWAVERGITGGTSATTFSPNSTCTRGQIVTFLYRDIAMDGGK